MDEKLNSPAEPFVLPSDREPASEPSMPHPDYMPESTFEPAAALADDISGAAAWQRDTDAINARAGIDTGGGIGRLSPEESHAAARERLADLDAPQSFWDKVKAFPSPLRLAYGAAVSTATSLMGSPDAGKYYAEQAGASLLADEKDKQAEREAIARVLANPNAQISGRPRAFAESVVQAGTNMPGAIVESIGIGAEIAGWSVGSETAKIGDNTVQAMGRWMQAKSREMFPGNPMAARDFETQLAQGFGSTMGFVGIQKATEAAKLAAKGSLVPVAIIGALSQGNQPYDEAITARSKGRDVSDKQLAIIYLIGLGIGATEALPIAKNLPGLSPQTRSKAMAFLGTMSREGVEEGGQEMLQQLLQNSLAQKTYDPNRDLFEDVTTNTIIGMISGVGVTGLRLAGSAEAKRESLREAETGNPGNLITDIWSKARDRVGRAPAVAPAGQPPSGDQRQVQVAPTADARTGQVDMTRYEAGDGSFPAAQPVPNFDPAAEISGSARYKSATRTLADITKSPAFPVNEFGKPDRVAFAGMIEQAIGRRASWNSLSADEKAKVEAVLGLPPIAVEQQQAAAAAQQSALAQAAVAQTQAAASPNPATAGAAVTPSMMADVARSRAASAGAGALAAAREMMSEEGPDGSPSVPRLATRQDYDSAIAAIDAEIAALKDDVAKRGATGRKVVDIEDQIAQNEAEKRALETGRHAMMVDNPDLLDVDKRQATDLNTSNTPAASWPQHALAAGLQDGTARIDNTGAPRLGPTTDAELAAKPAGDGPRGITEEIRHELADLEKQTIAAVTPAAGGKVTVQIDPVTVRRLVDRINTFLDDEIKAAYQRVARLTRTRNRAQLISKAVIGSLAREAKAAHRAELSDHARDLIEQSVEDALTGRPVAATVAKVAAVSAVQAVVDEVVKVTKHLDADAMEQIKGGISGTVSDVIDDPQTAALVQKMSDISIPDVLPESRPEDRSVAQEQWDQIVLSRGAPRDAAGDFDVLAFAGMLRDRFNKSVWGQLTEQERADLVASLTGSGPAKIKADSVKAPPKTADELLAEVKPPMSNDRLGDYTGVIINGFEGTPIGREGQSSDIKEAFLKETNAYLKRVAKELQARGFGPHMVVDNNRGRKAKGEKPQPTTWVNKGGPAVSGEVSLSMLHEGGNGVYVQISQSSIGVNHPGGLTVMARRADKGNRFGVKSQNLFWPSSLSVKEMADKLERLALGNKSSGDVRDQLMAPLTVEQLRAVANAVKAGWRGIDSADDIRRGIKARTNAMTDGAEQLAAAIAALPTVSRVHDDEHEVVRIYRDKGDAGLREWLDEKQWSDLQRIYKDELDRVLIKKTRQNAIDIIVDEAKTRADAKQATEQATPIVVDDPIIVDDTGAVVRAPESIIDASAAAKTVTMSEAARRYAVVLEKIGSDPSAFHDIIAKLRSDKSLKKADLDVIAMTYGGLTKAARSKAAAIAAIEKAFLAKAEAEDTAAVLAGDVANVTRDHEDKVDDRRRAEQNERDQQLVKITSAVSPGGVSEGLRQDGEGGDAAGTPRGDGQGGAATVRDDGRADAEPGTGKQQAVLQGGGDSAVGEPGGKRGGDARADTGASEPVVGSGFIKQTMPTTRSDIIAAVAKAKAEREANRRKNYRITEEDQIGKGGPKAKVRANIEAIRLVKKIVEEGRAATDDEKRVLVKYVGWGAFAQDMFDDYKPEWKAERQAFADLVSADEYAAARESTMNAHYTSPEVITGMWRALTHFGFKGGRVLEPSAGIGHFIGLMPEAMAANSDWTAVELDKLTGAIAKQLYQGTDVRIEGFEKTNFPDNYFDLAISNVPFGKYTLSDRKYNKLLVHDYFFVKALDRVRPGGMVAFITSDGTLDKGSGVARRMMDERGEFVGAVRLPGGNKGAFASNAGTAVTVDIIFFRKRIPGAAVDPNAPKFAKTIEHETPEGPMQLNEYFVANPDMMLGSMRLLGTQWRRGEPVLIGPTDNIENRIAEAAAKLPEDTYLPRGTTLDDAGLAPELASDSIKEGALYLKDGALYQKVAGAAVPQKASGKSLERIKSLMGIRDIVNDLLSGTAKGGNDASADHLRAKLNKAYDAFVKKYGPIGRQTRSVSIYKTADGKDGERVTVRYPNISGFDGDPDVYKIAAIEEYNAETDTAKKRAIFSSDILSVYTRPEIAGPAEALSVSLNESGHVDMVKIAEMLNVSQEEAAAELGDRVYKDPNGESWQTAEIYLSGDVVTKLEVARSVAERDADYKRNVKALEEVQPAPLTRIDIRTTFGTPWIPVEYYNAFIAKVIGISGQPVRFEPATSTWIYTSGSEDGYVPYAAQDAYGTPRVNVKKLVLAALNNKTVKVIDRHSDGTTSVNVEATKDAEIKIKMISEAFTGDQNAGIPGWIFEDEDRAQTLEALYNAKFNRLRNTKYDGSHLSFPGMAQKITKPNGVTEKFSLLSHQRNAVWRIIQQGNTLMDHSVGAGKTFASIAAGMEMKRLGMIQRPMYVVPNHMLEQFAREFYQAYPNAKLLVTDKESMSAKNRKAFAARVAADQWDGIIIKHSTFGRVSMKPEVYTDYIENEIAELLEAWLEAKRQAGENADIADFGEIGKPGIKNKSSRDPTIKEIERKKKSLEAKLSKLLNTERKDTGVTFEELGVDFLFVDEAHKFKNLDYTTRHATLKGLNVKGSQRATDLLLKIRHIEKSKPGRAAVFMTGTPMSRSMAEIYTMQRYLQNDTLREYGVDKFDNWFATFGRPETRTETGTNGKIKDVTSATFINVPELSALYSRVADSVTANDLGLPRPTVKGGAPQMVMAQMDEISHQMFDDLIKRVESLRGPVVKGADNHLSLYTKMRQVAADLRLLEPDAPFNPDGKVAKAVENIVRIYNEGKKPALAQIVWLDMGVPGTKRKPKKDGEIADAGDDTDNKIDAIRDALAGGDMKAFLDAASDPSLNLGDVADRLEASDMDEADVEDATEQAEIAAMLAGNFDLYTDIKQRLVAAGIPESEIAFIYDAKNDDQKAKLFSDVREGRKRVLLGSSEKMGVGTNVQRYLIAAHHLDAPWNPADVVQRDGRIIRQGNENKEVSIYRYVTERSADTLNWQILERKANAEAAFRAGARGVREMEDIDSPLPEASALKAAASGDRRIMEHAELTKQIRELEAAKRGHERIYLNAQRTMASNKAMLSQLEANLSKYQQDATMVTDLSGDNFKVRLDTRSLAGDVTERKAAGEAVRDQILAGLSNHWGASRLRIDLGQISGFKMYAMAGKTQHGLVATFGIEGAASYESYDGDVRVSADSDPVGVMRRFTNLVLNQPGLAKATENKIEQMQGEMPRLEKLAHPSPFPRAVQLATAKARHEELERQLRPDAARAREETVETADVGESGGIRDVGPRSDVTPDTISSNEPKVKDFEDRVAALKRRLPPVEKKVAPPSSFSREATDLEEEIPALASDGPSATNEEAAPERQPNRDLIRAVQALQTGSRLDLVRQHVTGFVDDVNAIAEVAAHEVVSGDARGMSDEQIDRVIAALDDLTEIVNDRVQLGYDVVDQMSETEDHVTVQLDDLSYKFYELAAVFDDMRDSLNKRQQEIEEAHPTPEIDDEEDAAPRGPEESYDDAAKRVYAKMVARDQRLGLPARIYEDYPENWSALDVFRVESEHMAGQLAALKRNYDAVMAIDPATLTAAEADQLRNKIEDIQLALHGTMDLAQSIEKKAEEGSRVVTQQMADIEAQQLRPALEKIEGVADRLHEVGRKFYVSLIRKEFERRSGQTLSDDDVAAFATFGDRLTPEQRASRGHYQLRQALKYERQLWLEGLPPADIVTRIESRFGITRDEAEVIARERFAAGRKSFDRVLAGLSTIEQTASTFDPSVLDNAPFVGEKEALYQDDMRRLALRQALIRELHDVAAGRGKGSADGHDFGLSKPGEAAAAGVAAAPAAAEGRGQRDEISQKLATEPDFRAAAVESFLAHELRQDAIESRAAAQGFDVIGYHGTNAVFANPDPFVQGADFGFHVGLGSPQAANARLGMPTTFRDWLATKVATWIAGVPAPSPENTSIIPLRLRVDNPLRLPDVTVVSPHARWSNPASILSLLDHPMANAPEGLKRWVTSWITDNTSGDPRALMADINAHRFSKAFAAELERLGYDGIVYKNTTEGSGSDSMLVWNASQVRSAYDFFHPDAAGADGLRASDDYVEQDLADDLARMMAEEGMTSAEATNFGDLVGDDSAEIDSAVRQAKLDLPSDASDQSLADLMSRVDGMTAIERAALVSWLDDVVTSETAYGDEVERFCSTL